jgi:hypothetical protein
MAQVDANVAIGFSTDDKAARFAAAESAAAARADVAFPVCGRTETDRSRTKVACRE